MRYNTCNFECNKYGIEGIADRGYLQNLYFEKTKSYLALYCLEMCSDLEIARGQTLQDSPYWHEIENLL